MNLTTTLYITFAGLGLIAGIMAYGMASLWWHVVSNLLFY